MSIILATTGEDGKLVTQNAENLSGAINSSQVSITFNSDLFDNGDVVVLDQEHILIGGDAGGGVYTACTRGYESTTKASHINGTVGFKKGGTEVLSHTFDGSTFLRLIRVASHEKDCTFAIKVDGVIKYRVTCSSYGVLEKVFPIMKTPAANTVIKVIAWSAPVSAGGLAQANVDAEMQS